MAAPPPAPRVKPEPAPVPRPKAPAQPSGRPGAERATARYAWEPLRDNQLALAAERQAKERSIVAKFKELKCDKHMDEHVLVSALQEYETSKAEEEKERMAKVAGHTYRSKNLIVYEKKEELEKKKKKKLANNHCVQKKEKLEKKDKTVLRQTDG